MPKLNPPKHGKNSIVRKGRNKYEPISPHTINCILQDVWGNKMQKTEVAVKYDVSRFSVYKFLNDNIDKKSTYEVFSPADVIKRAELPHLSRVELLVDDAVSSLEMAFALIRKILEQQLTEGVKVTLDVKELSLYIDKLAPYVLEKKNSSIPKEVKKTPDTPAKVLEMFKNDMKKAK